MGVQGLRKEVRGYVVEEHSLWATTTQRECDGRRKTERGLKRGVSPLKAKHELQSSSSKILEEKTRKSTPTFARG